MWYTNQVTFVAVLIQAIGLVLIAGLMLPIARAVQGRYLTYWSAAWASLAIGQVCHYFYLVEEFQPVTMLIAGCVSQYFFGFMLWAGCRNAVENERLNLSRFVAMVPLSIFAVVGPITISQINYFFPFQAVIMGSLLTLAFLTVGRVPRAALMNLILVFGRFDYRFSHSRSSFGFTQQSMDIIYSSVDETCLRI